MSILDLIYRTLRAAYLLSYAAYRLVDLVWSVGWASMRVGGGAILGGILAIAVQAGTGYGVYRCLFPPELPATGVPLSPVAYFVQDAPVISAFIVFAVGESAVVIVIYLILKSIFEFKLVFLLGSRDDDAEGLYSPIGEGLAEAEDPLTF